MRKKISGLRGATFVLLLVSLLLSACGGRGDLSKLSPEPDGAAGRALSLAVDREVVVQDLRIVLKEVTLEPDRVLLALTLRNPSPGHYTLLLGGCGPSQGRVIAKDRWLDLDYFGVAGGDLTGDVPPHAERSGVIALKVRDGETIVPGHALELELHPGYVLDRTDSQLQVFGFTLALNPVAP